MRITAGVLNCAKATLLFACTSLAGCGVESSPEGRVEGADTSALPPRNATVLIDSCVIDTWQQAELESAAMKKVVQEVVLLCLVPQYDGSVAPSDPSGVAAVSTTITYLQGLGYTAKLGVSFSDESGQRSDATQTSILLANHDWQTKVTNALVAAAQTADGIDLDFEVLQPSARADVTLFVQTLAAAVHAKKKTIAVYVPPVTVLPSDIPSAGAYDLASYDGVVDKVRVTTLDYSTPDPGPTIDPGWAVDALSFVHGYVKSTPLDISYPLYGADFSARGIRGTSWYEARALADEAGISDFPRGPTGAPNFAYTSPDGTKHDIWFDDSVSTQTALSAWDYSAVPSGVGLFFWGLGAEDPQLWGDLARRSP